MWMEDQEFQVDKDDINMVILPKEHHLYLHTSNSTVSHQFFFSSYIFFGFHVHIFIKKLLDSFDTNSFLVTNSQIVRVPPKPIEDLTPWHIRVMESLVQTFKNFTGLFHIQTHTHSLSLSHVLNSYSSHDLQFVNTVF
jgi:hypothetical protein